MDENKRFDTQNWDTDAVRRKIMNEVDGAVEPAPKRKRRKLKFNWKIYVAAVLLGSMLLAGLGWILANDMCALDKGDETYSVTIEEGDGIFTIASKLKKAGLIRLSGFFVLYEIISGAKDDIDPGTYELNTSMDYRSLVHNMYDPEAERREQEGLVLITIPEGYSVLQIVDLLAENGIATKEELVDAVSNFDFGEEYPFIDNSRSTEWRGICSPTPMNSPSRSRPSMPLTPSSPISTTVSAATCWPRSRKVITLSRKS